MISKVVQTHENDKVPSKDDMPTKFCNDNLIIYMKC